MGNKNSIYYLLLFVLAAIVPNLSFAQTETMYPKQVGIGLRLGSTFSMMKIDLPTTQSSTLEPNFGLIFNYIDKKTVGIQLELNYVTKNWQENPSADLIFDAKMNYIEIPMLTTLHFGNKLKLLVNFGPYLSILLNETHSHNITTSSNYLQFYENRNPKKGDFGMTGGAGLRYQTKIGLFQLEGRYAYGFQNLYDADDSNLNYSNLTTISVFVSYQYLLFNGK